MELIEQTLNELKNADANIREAATHRLWNLWTRQAGDIAEMRLQQGTDLLNDHRIEEAEQVFVDLLKKYPDFPEAHNKLATVLFLMGRYDESVAECDATLQMIPYHFGAWNGKGMCLYKLLRYEEAIKSFEMALKIQPYADANRGYIARCRGRLN